MQIATVDRTFARVRPIRALGGTKAPDIIGLYGRKEVGKDAAAALLAMVGYDRLAFGDEIKREIDLALTLGQCPMSLACNQSLLAEWNAAVITKASAFRKPMTSYMRRLIQWWGTEYRRSENPNYWVAGVEWKIIPQKKYVISDVRFPNEATMILARGGVIWEIARRGAPADDHVSENQKITPDLRIDNNGTLLDMAREIKAALQI